MSSLTFDDGNRILPSREYARGWPDFTRQYWPLYLAHYRDRVTSTYANLAEQRPTSFPLLPPVSLLVIVSLIREWVFARPADVDTITLEERWEDPTLATWDMYDRADHEQVVRGVVGVDPELSLVSAEPFESKFGLRMDQAPTVLVGNLSYGAGNAADRHASNAMRALHLQAWEDSLRGRQLDRPSLASLLGRLMEIELLSGANRGNRFETWMGDLLTAHGCDVEHGIKGDGEQIDAFVHRPFRAIMECRWRDERLQPRELSDLTAKLSRRPAIVAGIYVSMSGFTAAAHRHANSEPHGRTVLLWERSDINRLVAGEIHVLDLFDEHVSARVRSYPVSPTAEPSKLM